MSDKVSKPITNRQFAFFGGIGLTLLSLVLVLNMWVVARVLSFPFFYLFGLMAYFFFGYILVQGVYALIKRKLIKFKFSIRLVGIVLLIISVDLLLTAFYKPSYNLSSYNEFIGSLNYVTYPSYLNLFKEPIAGGLFGILLFEVLNNIAQVLPFIIGFLVFFVSLGFIFMNPILALVNNYQSHGHNHEKVRNHRRKKERREDESDEIFITRDNTNDVIRGAGYIEEPVKEEPITRPIAPEPISSNPNSLNSDSINTFPYRENNSEAFKPAHFIPGVIPGDNQSTVMNNPKPSIAPSAPTFEQPVIENKPATMVNPQPQVVAPQPQPVVSEKSEQLTLNFDEPKIDNSLVTAAPVFQDPISINKEVAPQVSQPVPAPVNKPRVKWVAPSTELLEVYEVDEANNANIEVADQRVLAINTILNDFHVGAEVEGYTIGPSVTRYNVKYESNVEIKSVERKVDDIARRLGGVMCRFEPIVRGTEYSGLEIPNARVTTVSFKDVFEKLPDAKKHPTAIAFGKNIQGEVISADFADFPHLLVAGTTGSGKSIFIHSIISTLIMRNSPDDLKLVLVDPKRVEMVKYRDIPHLLCPIINDPKKAKPLLDKLVDEMNARYDILAQGDGFSNIGEYNEYARENNLDTIPVIIAVLDEYGDLVETCKDISRPVLLLGQKARACGIHILIATQSPTSDIITGTIKSNLPTHVALSTSTATQSVTILGEGGAEKLLGKGDMLVQCPRIERGASTRLQGCYIAGKEISRIAGYLREHYPTQYDEKFLNLEEEAPVDGQLFVANGGNNTAMDDAEELKYQDIKGYVMTLQYTSMSKIQGDCGIGFNRARRFFNRLVQEGIVNATSEGNKGCKVLVHDSGVEIGDDSNIPVSDELSN